MSIKVFNNENDVTISSTKENFVITVADTKDGDPLELAHITIHLLGRVWNGSIQDIASIHSYGLNAFNLIAKYGGEDVPELKELQQLLQHFGQIVEIPAPSPERSKELALISCIITHNYFDEMLKHTEVGGVVHCYDVIADMAAEFYDKYRYHKEWEDVPAEFTGATGWEDCICMFTESKMKSL